jgi:hypothetical protein
VAEISSANTTTRRELLSAAASTLAALSLNSFTRGSGEERTATSSYTAPDLELLVQSEEVFKHEPCSSQRLDDHLKNSCTVKFFVGPDGNYLVRPIEALVREGWAKQNHTQRLTSLSLKGNPQAGDPDIRPSVGSGVFLRTSGGVHRFFSNDHVLCAGRWELERQRVSNWAFDVASIDPALLSTRASDGPLPKTALAPDDVTNEKLTDMRVDLYGIGADLFRFIGKPFPIPFTVPSLGGNFGQRILFGLRLPERSLHHPAEIAGMSGSPVVIEGTSSVVGLVVRVHQVWQGSRVANIIMFVGPDEIRDLGDQK